jgi:hypothetical protein
MPKASKAIMNSRPPKRVKNDAFEQVNDLVERHRGTTRIASNEWGDAIGGPGGKPVSEKEFPVRINKPNRNRDTRMRLKHQYARQYGADGRDAGINLGQPMLNDGDLQAFSDIEKQKQIVSFESWLASYLNMADPATAKLVDEIMPEYWEKRQEVIENQAELQKNIALIRLRGPTSKKDFMILYMLNTGQLPLPRGTIFEPEKWSYSNANFNRGMANPRRYYPPQVKLDAAGKADPIGAISKAYGAGFGAGVSAPNANLPSIGRLDQSPGAYLGGQLVKQELF